MDDLKALLNVLAGRGDEVIEAHDSKGVWRKAKFSHRHPTRKLLVFGLGDDMHGLFCWHRDTGNYPHLVKGRAADVKVRQNEIRINGSTYHFEATELQLKS